MWSLVMEGITDNDMEMWQEGFRKRSCKTWVVFGKLIYTEIWKEGFKKMES